MTMPKFEPVGYRDASGDYHYANTSRGDYVALYTSNQITEAYEAGKRDASEDLEQAAFEKWLYDKCPSGDAESVQRQWLESYEYAELAGKRDATPEWQPIETAPRGILEILLRSPNGKIANGYWGQECNRGKGAWVWPYVKSEPSHWMPLPAASKGEA